MTVPLVKIAKHVLMVVFFLSSHALGDPLRHWKDLLHYHNGRSMVKSDSFFLSINGNADYQAELKSTIDLINSDNGETIACNFPARYSWLKSQGYPVRSIDLNRCPELMEFVAGFQKGTLSLVLASDNIDSAASAFGHLVLVLSRGAQNQPRWAR